MRIIDQCGLCDVPYDMAYISIDDGAVIAYTANNLKFVLATYSDVEMAKKAMKKMHIAYQRYRTDPFNGVLEKGREYYQFPPEEYL